MPARTPPTDHKTVLDLALAQIPVEYIESLEILVRADRAGATHELADYCREARMRFSFGYDLTDAVRQAILETPEDAWVPALDQDDTERENGEVCGDHRACRSVLLARGIEADRSA